MKIMILSPSQVLISTRSSKTFEDGNEEKGISHYFHHERPWSPVKVGERKITLPTKDMPSFQSSSFNRKKY